MSGQTVPEIEFRTYDHLPEEAVEIRREVFMDEQGHEGELDDVYGRATATCRLFAGSRKGVPHVWISKRLGTAGEPR